MGRNRQQSSKYYAAAGHCCENLIGHLSYRQLNEGFAGTVARENDVGLQNLKHRQDFERLSRCLRRHAMKAAYYGMDSLDPGDGLSCMDGVDDAAMTTRADDDEPFAPEVKCCVNLVNRATHEEIEVAPVGVETGAIATLAWQHRGRHLGMLGEDEGNATCCKRSSSNALRFRHDAKIETGC